MSSGNDGEAELIQLANQALKQNYCLIAAAALLIFEHAITLTDEIDYIWRRKKTGVTILFISNRFLGLVLALSMIVGIPPWNTNPSCDGTLMLLDACEELLFIEWAIFSTLRVYAVGGQAWLPAAVVFILSLIPFATNLYSYIVASYYVAVVPGFGPICMQVANEVQPKMFSLTTRISVIVADVIVLTITWMKTYNIKRYANSDHMETPLATLLLRDGTLHFMLLLLLNLAQMLLNYYEIYPYVDYFVDVFTCIIVSRLLLNLRQVNNMQNHVTSNLSFVRTPVQSLQFASRIIGNMGASLSFGSPSEVDDLYELDLLGNGLDVLDGEEGAGEEGVTGEIELVEVQEVSLEPLGMEITTVARGTDEKVICE